jgi:hypothetical protein
MKIAQKMPQNMDGNKSGIHIEIGTKSSKRGFLQMPKMASTMKIYPGKPLSKTTFLTGKL